MAEMALNFSPNVACFFVCYSVIKIGQELLNEVSVERFILADLAIYYFLKLSFNPIYSNRGGAFQVLLAKKWNNLKPVQAMTTKLGDFS